MISSTWLTSLRLENRKSPEFIQSGDDLSGVPHGSMIHQSFEELNLVAMHCISGVPSIGFLVQQDFNQEEVDRAHKALWNQGLASLLLVINKDTLRAYSLFQIPEINSSYSEKLIRVFDHVKDALELKNLILGMESGRFITRYKDKFDSRNRVDQILLANLETTVKKLVGNKMKLEPAQALLMQIMFISYLEDKKIINFEYFQKATNDSKIDSLKTLLTNGDIKKFTNLFALLKQHFNGDLFVAPCSFEVDEKIEELSQEHINILSEFRAGNIDLNSGQYQIWPYDFRFIPIELISAVYDRFLGFNPTTKRESGTYYTPIFLADLVIEQAWSELKGKQKITGKYVDPSCGSGIFLVCLFDKMIDEWRSNHNSQYPTWPTLLAMLNRLYGYDIKKESIRVAAFSLYIALLENSKPAEILLLMKKGRLLPKLCGKTLHAIDFFEVSSEYNKYDLIIGNPPWVSRRGNQLKADKWCKENQFEMPAKEIAWGFAWKALLHSNNNGVVALLLKATSFITSQSPTILKTRKKWMDHIRLIRIVNLADTRFQLFDGGNAPTALIIYKSKNNIERSYKFDYWVPKADLNLKTKRMITLSSIDKMTLPIDLVIQDQLLMKRRMWMQTPDAKLFQYLNVIPKLSDRLITYQNSKKKEYKNVKKWIIGQGFIPVNMERLREENYKPCRSTIVEKIPHLSTDMFQPLVMHKVEAKAWHTDLVYRKGFEEGFNASHILIPQGVDHTQGRLRASYCMQSLSFRSSIQAIRFEKSAEAEAKFLTVLLNSSLVAWFLFHNSSVTGMERDKVPQHEILEIPFPSLNRMSNYEESSLAFNNAVSLIDELVKKKDDLLKEQFSEISLKIDQIIYQYFNLSKADILIIEDTLHHIVPSMQPRARSKNNPSLWIDTSEKDWKFYAEHLSTSLTNNWLEKPYRAVVELVGASLDLVVIGVHLTDNPDTEYFAIKQVSDIDKILPKIWNNMPQNLSGNFQLIPDLRIFIEDVLYIVKPRKKRFWLGSTALADADAIAADLLSQGV
jgi:hypothetical protein